MKTSEDKLNEALRAALKRKFDDYEGVPFSSPFARKPARLVKGRKWKYLFLTALFLAVSVGVVITNQRFRKSAKLKINDVNVAKINTKKINDDHALKETKTLNAPSNLMHSVSKKKMKQTKNNSFVSGNKIIHHVHGKNGLYLNKKLKEQDITFNQNPIENKNTFEINSKINDQGVSNLDNIENNTNVNSQNYFAELLASKQIKSDQNRLTLPAIDSAGKQDQIVIANKKPEKLSWLFNVSALQTYQILTVPSAGSQNLQNFSFPSAFSLRSLGYKFSVGVEKKGVQLMLHYSGFRRSYSYEIVGNDYIVEPGSQGDYKIVRQAMRISEDKKLSLLGIGISKRIQWGQSNLNKFYASGGLEYSHSLRTQQSLGWVNIGVGKQFLVNRRIILQAGPYAEFSPVKISGSEDPFYYQPYRIGISLGIKLANP